MKILAFALSFPLCAAASGQTGTPMPDMPGMSMPHPTSAQPMSKQPSSAQPSLKPSPKQQSMPGRPPASHPQTQSPATPSAPNRNQKAPVTMAPDMQGMQQDKGDPKAEHNAAMEADATKQQARQQVETPDDRSDQESLQVPIQDLQEPEALDIRTGGDLPAPELLGEIVARQPLSLEHFLSMADAANPTLAQAQRNVDRSVQQARQASLPPNPTLGYSGDHIRGGEYRAGEQGAFFSQEFVLGHKLALRRKIYLAEGRSNQYALEVQRARVHNDVARAFVDTLAAQQSVVLQDRLLKVALDADTNAHELSRVGQTDAAAILTAEVAAEQARVDFLAAQRLFLAHFAQLATFAGQPLLEVHPLTGALVDPPSLDPAEYVARDTEQSPLVKQAQADSAVSEARLQDAKRESVPNLNLTAGEWYSGEPVHSGAKAGWESFVQAGVQLPLWNRNQGNVEAAKLLVDRSHHEVERTRLWTRNQTDPLAQAYETARFTAERYRTQMLPRARRAYQLQVTKYQEMSQEYPPVLAAQHLLFTLQLSYTEALKAEWHAAIALQNYGLMNGLDAPASGGSDTTTINLPTAAGFSE